MITFRIHFGYRLSVLLAAGVGLTAHLPLRAQTPSPADILGASPVMAEKCNGPLGSLLPECQSLKSTINISAGTPGVGSGSNPGLYVPPAKGAAPEREVQPPAVRREPPTEFQRFAASSVGEVLPIFGASLFEAVPTTFAPLDRVPVTANYVIGPGDEILLRVWGQVNLDLALTVDRAGAIFLPQAGNLKVAGIEFQQLASYLRAQLGRVFRNFDLNVNLGQLRSIQILVVGSAHRPGTYTVSSLSTLVNALFASGGPSAQGSMRRIQLKRGAEVQSEFDLYDLLLSGDKSKDVRLLPGDVVYIPSVGPRVAIAGSVKTPAIYELSREKTVGDLVHMAGGLSAVADPDHSTLERIQSHAGRESMAVRLDSAGMKTALADGDVLRISTITPKFENTVTLRGSVASPGRFPWHAGMRLREIIPDKESLVTRDYWKKRNTLGFAPPDDVPAEPSVEAARRPASTAISSSAPDVNWSYAVIERQNPVNLATDLIPFHLGRLILEKDENQNLELRAGDVVTIFSQRDFRVAIDQQTRFVWLEGEFEAAGVYAVRPGETLGRLIRRAGGITPQAYLFGAEFTRESTRTDQQRRLDRFVQELQHDVEHTAANKMMGATTPEQSLLVGSRLQNERVLIERISALKATGRIVLSLDAGSNDLSKLMDFALEDGDRFLVPAKPATVSVLGAVYNQNSFVYQPNLKISDYLRLAGGANRNADTGRMFLIAADGSVVPKRGFHSSSGGFEATTIHPGDSVVVPEAIFRATFFQGLREWSQVFTQFALGAAAVNLLK